MTNNEIDDIFSSAAGESGKTSSNKKKGKTGKSESSDPIGNVKEKKTQSEKKKISAPQSNTAGKRKVAETVIDPSKMVERAASTSAKKQKKGKSSTTKGISNEDEEFRDSRGTISEFSTYIHTAICSSY